MFYYKNLCHDPYRNHALEEYFLRHGKQVFMLWQNEPAVLLGVNQNAYRECDLAFMKEHHIRLVRRISGGGAIYTDRKNMQYSFVTDKSIDFEYCAKRVVEAMHRLNIPCEYSGRNDIVIEGAKVSGNASCNKKYFSLNHGTLLFDCDVNLLKGSLKPPKLKFQDKAVKSVSKRVGFIKDYTSMDIFEFMDRLTIEIFDIFSLQEINDQEIDFSEVEEIRQKYLDTEFIYGRNGHFTHTVSKKHEWGLIEYHLRIDNGKIRDIKMEGDFFGDAHVLEEALKNEPYTIDNVEKKLAMYDTRLLPIKDIVGDLFEKQS